MSFDRVYESPACQPGQTQRQPARQVVSSVIDYQIFKVGQSSGVLVDAFVQLQRPYTKLIFLGTDGSGSVTPYFSFIATGQTQGNATGNPPFVPAKSLQSGIIAIQFALAFKKPISQFYLSFTDTSAAPANYWFMATNDIDLIMTVNQL